MSEPTVTITEARFFELVEGEKRVAGSALPGALLITQEEYESLKADAEKWRNRGHESLSVDVAGKFSIDGFEVKDAQLGALVRRMPEMSALVHARDETGKSVWGYSAAYRVEVDMGSIRGTPEETLMSVVQEVDAK